MDTKINNHIMLNEIKEMVTTTITISKCIDRKRASPEVTILCKTSVPNVMCEFTVIFNNVDKSSGTLEFSYCVNFLLTADNETKCINKSFLYKSGYSLDIVNKRSDVLQNIGHAPASDCKSFRGSNYTYIVTRELTTGGLLDEITLVFKNVCIPINKQN